MISEYKSKVEDFVAAATKLYTKSVEFFGFLRP